MNKALLFNSGELVYAIDLLPAISYYYEKIIVGNPEEAMSFAGLRYKEPELFLKEIIQDTNFLFWENHLYYFDSLIGTVAESENNFNDIANWSVLYSFNPATHQKVLSEFKDYIIDSIGKAYPSDTESVFALIPPGDEYNGAHHYRIIKMNGVDKDGNASYQVDSADGVVDIVFVRKAETGEMIPGIQNEQLVMILLDRTEKLNKRFPSPENEQMMNGLKLYLDSCKKRVDDRIARGVMGELKK